MTTTHTPGPWRISTPDSRASLSPYIITSESGRSIAQVHTLSPYDAVLDPLSIGDANLITAAPALLEAAEAAVAALTQPATFPADINAAVLWLTNAIAAAKGGAQ